MSWRKISFCRASWCPARSNRVMKRHYLFHILAAMGVCFAFAARAVAGPASAGNAATPGGIVLTVARLPSAASSTPTDIAEWRVVEEFHKRYPEIELRGASGIQVAGLGEEI